MTISVNTVGMSHARSLIASGDVDRTSDWSFSAADGNAILGDNTWGAYSRMHLAVDSEADKETKEHYKYPFGKDGKVYRSGLIAIRQRAGQQGQDNVFNAAGALLDLIGGDEMKNCLKAISRTDNELRVGNYMVLFGGRDLVGEFFTKGTVFDSNFTDIGVMYVDFEHGQDVDGVGNAPSNVLGVVDWKSAKIDDKGIFVERILNRRSKYVLFLEKLIDAGIVGTSSEAVSSGVRKKSSGEIVAWPLMRDSLTVTPMEPRMICENALVAAKALADAFPKSRSLAALVGNEVENPVTVDDVKDLKSAEQFLREAGLRKQEATAFVSRLKSLVRSDSDAGEEAKELVELLKQRSKHVPKSN